MVLAAVCVEGVFSQIWSHLATNLVVPQMYYPRCMSMVKHNVTGTNHYPDAYLIMLVFRCIVAMLT